MKWKSALSAAAVVIPLLWVLAHGFKLDPHAVPSVLEGFEAPTFSMASLEGRTFDVAALHGKPAVLNFWATWCYPCQAEHQLLQEAARYYGDKVQFLGVIYQDNPDEVRRYLIKHPSAYPHLIDPNSRYAIDFGVAGVPESFILDPNGQIIHKQAGVLTAAVLRQFLDPLAAGKE